MAAIVQANLFSDANLQKAVDDAMDKLGPDAKGGLVVHGDLEGASLVAVVKAGDHWSIDLGVEATYKGQFSGEVSVVYHW